MGEQVAVTRHVTHFLTFVTTCLPGTSFACQESRTLRTRVAALESTGSEGLAQLVPLGYDAVDPVGVDQHGASPRLLIGGKGTAEVDVPG